MKPSVDARLESYPSFQAAKEAGVPNDILARAAAETDVDYVEELDI